MLKELPPLASIESVEAEDVPVEGRQDFVILESRSNSVSTVIPADAAVCEACLKELTDKNNRRYRYPFINCTHCGPRYTITAHLPYDRPQTSMKAFPMCPDCDREYHDIEDRRYHAQPDCCPVCGPQVFFLDAEGNRLEGDAIELAREYVKNGKIIAVKGLGGMHLACSCAEPEVAMTLRRRKQRDEKPFAIMCRDVETAKKICRVSPDEEKILNGFRRPIVLLEKREPGMEHISENNYVGVMLPYTPLHYLLFGDDIDMLIMTSANLSDTPIMYKNAEAVEKLHGIADGFLLHDREIQTRCDDSLCWVLDGKEYPARRSRGYVPFPVKVADSRSRILACGAEQKASFCLSKEDYVFQSQHIGDLKNLETFENYEQQIRHFERLFDIVPRALACDMHPDYMSTAYAAERGAADNVPVVRVQHHHAHMAACMADNNIDHPVIGLIWDGTGYGTDGTTWGAECLTGDCSAFERRGSIREIPLIGGDKATKETDRVAFALLRDAGFDAGDFPWIENAEIYGAMLDAGLNCPPSSGMGRLFDGVAAILGIKRRCSYEGQGAVLLEAAASADDGVYNYTLDGAPLRFDWRDMIRGIVTDMNRGDDVGAIAARFMNTLIDMATRQCGAARSETGLDSVVLSGGTFQNMYLMRGGECGN